MTQLRTAIPRGVQDTLPAEMHHQRRVEEEIKRRFYLAGYNEIQTPSFEFYDVFSHGIGSVGQERLIKFFDDDGRILALRPDLTLPIARLVATRAVELPFRACYVGNAFDMQGTYGRQKEFSQAGVELLGAPGPEADAEVILLAAEALRAAGLEDFQIELGQVDFFKGLLEEWKLTSFSEELRQMVDEKNMLEIELFFQHSRDIRARNAILSLTSLYGGAETLEAASKLSAHDGCRAAIENLRQIYEILCDFGIGDKLCFDFGMLHSLDYYSGVIFRGMTQTLNMPLLSGGRYDKLVGEFGREAEATGFAMGVKRILTALERMGKLGEYPSVGTLVSCSPSARAKAYSLINEMKANGERVEMALNLNENELKAFALKRGCKALYIV